MRLGPAIIFSALLLIPPVPESLEAQEGNLIILVRHAERADDGDGAEKMAADPEMAMMLGDPPLSEAGRNRASLLAEMLRSAGINHVHSTDYRRTLETGQPSAEEAGVEMVHYDASRLEEFAAKLRATAGRHLVIGHSNTTPELVRALGGDPGPPIAALEYDRLYILTLQDTGVSTLLLRFGAPSRNGSLQE